MINPNIYNQNIIINDYSLYYKKVNDYLNNNPEMINEFKYENILNYYENDKIFDKFLSLLIEIEIFNKNFNQKYNGNFKTLWINKCKQAYYTISMEEKKRREEKKRKDKSKEKNSETAKPKEIIGKIEQIKKKSFIRIKINFYDLYIRHINVDLELKGKKLALYIFGKLGFGKEKRIYKRTDKSQTTENIILNPIIKYENSDYDDYDLFYYFLYKGLNIETLINKKIKGGGEIFLKINNEYINYYINNSIKIWTKGFNRILYPDEIFIYFQMENKTKKIIICNIKEKLSKIIEEYLERIGFEYKEVINNKKIIFKLENKELNEFNKTLKDLNFSDINFIDVTIIKEIEKVDESLIKFNENKKEWEKINKGLNVVGLCRGLKEDGNKCKVWNKNVIYSPGLEDKFEIDISEEMNNLKCPICNLILDNIFNCGFWNCEYQIVSSKNEGGIMKNYNIGPKVTKDNNIEYCDELFKGSIFDFDYIKIYVLPKQEIEYKEN